MMTKLTRRPTPQERVRDRGTIAVLGALVFTVVIGMAALVVDGGYLAMRRRAMQGVADAAALAGGYSLPTSATAITQARSNATANGYTDGASGVTVTVTSPYLADSRRIEVIVQTNVPTFLGKAMRINTGLVRGRAVAKIDPPTASVFAGGTACGGQACGVALCINGTDYDIQGSVHSNASLVLGGDATDSTGPAEYKSPCAATVNGPVGISSGPTSVATQPYPISYTAADFPCTYSQASGTFDVSQPGAWWQSGNAWGGGGVLKPGVYCAPTGGIQLNGSHLSGNVTFVARDTIQISGQFLNMTANKNNVFLYTSSAANPAIVVGSQDLTWTGAVFAPNGFINISGTNFNVGGSIIGNNVYLGATNWTLTGSSGSSGPYLSE